MTRVNDRFVLVSVSDKTGIEKLAKAFVNAKYKIIATGGTARYLRDKKISVLSVEKVTNFPEMLDGRVKTLHPAVFGGILASSKSHLAQIRKISAPLIDVVVVNFYPFEKFAFRDNTDIPSCDMIDIGGVALLRAAAKNYNRVLAVSSIGQYDEVINCLNQNGGSKEIFPPEMKKRYAAVAFQKTSHYDSFIASVFNSDTSILQKGNGDILSLSVKKNISLRYGENPHQTGIFCSAELHHFNGWKAKDIEIKTSSIIKSLGNKNVSYNNLLDVEVGLSILRALCKSGKKDDCKFGCSIIKHTNPCGVAVSNLSSIDAYKMALSTDRISAFGGVVVFNSTVDKKCAQEMLKIFTDCVAAPGFSDEALKVLQSKKNLSVLKISPDFRADIELRSCLGGILLQNPDTELISSNNLKVVTKKKPTSSEMKSLLFAYTVAKFCKSNAIVIASGTRTIGIGAGTTSRIDAFKLAASKIPSSISAKKDHTPIVLASDGFFPFDDVVREAARLNCGISAIIQPGGSIRDEESIKACDELGLAMVFAGIRHFRH